MAAPAGSARSRGGGARRPPRQRRLRRGHRRRAGRRRLPRAGAPAPAAHAGDRLRHAPPRRGGRDHDHGEPQPAAGQRLQAVPGRRRPDRPAGRRGDLRAASTRSGRSRDLPLSADGVESIGDEVVDAYVDGAVGLLDDGPRRLEVVYTAMHGVGAETVRAAFARAGFPALREVAEQVEPDPDFPTVAFPNPEEPGALDLVAGAGALLRSRPRAGQRSRRRPPRGGDPGRHGRGRLAGAHRRRDRERPRRPPAPDRALRARRRRGHHRRVLTPALQAGGRGGRRLRRGAHRVQVGGPHARAGSAVRLRLRGGAGLLRGRARPRQGRHHRGTRGRRPRRPAARRRARRWPTASTSSPGDTAPTSRGSGPSA